MSSSNEQIANLIVSYAFVTDDGDFSLTLNDGEPVGGAAAVTAHLPAHGPGTEDLVIQALVLRVLQALDEEARAVIAFDIDGTPTADIARELRITQQRVRDVRERARAALKHQLSENAACEGGKQA
jgi:DNA-directed RNA polymerase specialized sigma24 family protein